MPRTFLTAEWRKLIMAQYEVDPSNTTLAMRHSITSTPAALNVEYSWRFHRAWNTLAVQAFPTPQPIVPGSEEEFITEHYWGYTKRRGGFASEYAVQHPRWHIYPIREFSVQADFAALYGSAFASLNVASPSSVLLAEGSAVSVSSGVRLSC